MKKFLFMFLLAAAVASVFTFVVADEDQDGKKFVIHGEIRERADYNDNFFDFDNDVADSFLIFPYRARLAAEGHFGKGVVGYAEFQTIGVWGDDIPNFGETPGPVGGTSDGSSLSNVLGNSFILDQNINNDGNNDVKLYQGYIALTDIAGSHFTLKFGRQEIVKGSEMLLGDNDFYAGLSHDAALACWNTDSIDLDLWWSRPFQSQFGVFGTPDHGSVNFYGAWVDFKKIPANINVAAYLLYYEDGRQAGLPDPARRAFYTVGGRANHSADPGQSGLVWSGELALQKGDFNNGPSRGDTGDISAMAFELMAGWQFHTGNADHIIKGFFARASGDDDPLDSDNESFDPLFQDSHMRYGFTDLFTLSDLTAASIGWNMRMNDHSFGVDYWMYRMTEEELIAGNNEDDLGTEIDGWWKYQYSPNTQVMAGVGLFMPGDAIEASLGTSADSYMRVLGNLRLRF
ncbi:MAG TPA: alginate export family protein [Candidatus Polarisedimenticolia bacterium]|jgi:hypothetical protein|nr:alginate export family protein [Candidatus Polarisedimenticolia bacterium]